MTERECSICKVSDAKRYIRWKKGDEYKDKILCSRHYHQLLKKGRIEKNSFDKNEIRILDDCAEIVLVNRSGEETGVCLIDKDDIDKVKHIKWYLDSKNRYCLGGGSSRTKIRIHRFLMGINDNSIFVDHIDRNKLNNRRLNLRACSPRDNCINSNLSKRNTSGFTGVYFNKEKKKWTAQIVVERKTISLGRYINKNDAILARLNAELKYFGIDFAPQRHLFVEYRIGVE